MSYAAGVVGFRGYSGMELQRILARHPRITPVLLEHRADSTEKPPPMGYAGPARVPCTPEGVKGANLAVVFLATPPEVSMELTSWMLDFGVRVVDLSGAFRLVTAEIYQHWYKEQHQQPSLLTKAVYGLPEVNRESIRRATLIANPGCYPTAANLALRPLVSAGLIDRSTGIVCDAKSGVSGAGRKPSLKTSFCEVTENFSAYSILAHRHVPEVLMTSGLREEEFSFTAQLIPVHRGILETIYFRASRGVTAADMVSAYRKAYQHETFVRLYTPNQMPDLHAVNHTNYCDIGFHLDEATRRCVVVTAIDNLVKGAAGQAVQNMNLMMDLPESEGLP